MPASSAKTGAAPQTRDRRFRSKIPPPRWQLDPKVVGIYADYAIRKASRRQLRGADPAFPRGRKTDCGLARRTFGDSALISALRSKFGLDDPQRRGQADLKAESTRDIQPHLAG